MPILPALVHHEKGLELFSSNVSSLRSQLYLPRLRHQGKKAATGSEAETKIPLQRVTRIRFVGQLRQCIELSEVELTIKELSSWV